MPDEPLALVDADLDRVLALIADAGFAGTIDQDAADELGKLVDQRLVLTRAPLEFA